MKNYCSQILVIAISVLPSISIAKHGVEDAECLAYWQLRSVGLEREHGIESAKRANHYQQSYRSGLDHLKQTEEPSALAKQVFDAMQTMLEAVDYDYDRTGELESKYSAICISSQ